MTQTVYAPNFRRKQKYSESYKNLVTFISIPFALFFLQTFKTPEAIILDLFSVVFQELLPEMRSNLYKIFIMHNDGLIRIAFVVDNFKILKVFCISSHLRIGPFGRVLGPNSPKYGSILLPFSH